MILPKNACANCGADLDVVRMSACCNHPGRIVPFSIADFPADPVPDLQATIARLTVERDEARASAAAAYERAAEALLAHGLHDDDAEIDLIRALATEAETSALAEMLDAETRACADLFPVGSRDGDMIRSTILARLDQRKEAGANG